ncbi:FMN-linked oxidoreductase [Delitschia confertaspora ATCC 74209]|uniref:Dihydroorotate dehydrogenase (quinone), mitochondrial n=1 Tax=Delitschia confertaspora ATCC 74209 TaxID=1513339 RepID=A0A9P4JIW0_9PLEO|nr:FMN-linked oxidoreductase [Delitschia confertaspora ATCC 74209]
MTKAQFLSRALRTPHCRLISRTPLSPLPLSVRWASTTATASETATNVRSFATRTKNLIYGTSLALVLSFGYLYVTDTRAGYHEWLTVPALRLLYADAEDAHHNGTAALQALYKFGLHPRERGDPDAAGDLQVEVFGQTIVNPIATSAGIDKHGEIPTQLLAIGPAIVEVGAVTALPQFGNPKPRVFRLPSQNALINRYGFNSEGAEAVAMRLRRRVREFAYHMGFGLGEEGERIVLDGEAGVPPGSLTPGRLMAVQVAKNKDTSENNIEAVKRDYTFGVHHLGKYADIIVVNVSSPNTPGLRTLQNVGPLTDLLTSVVQAVQKIDRKTKPAVMVKVSPDEDSQEQISGICEAVWDSGVDGVIVGNTTKKRPDPIPKGYVMPQKERSLLLEQGGYSGPQMFERTLELVKRYRKTLDDGPKEVSSSAGRKVIFATGGITNGKQALEILDAGASVASVYTALIYGGVGTISRIKEEIREEKLKR